MKVVCSGNIGDCIYSLPYCKTLKSVEYYLKLGVRQEYNTTVTHPLKNLRMNAAFASLLIPLFEAQSYITKCAFWTNENCIDLDRFRETPLVNFRTSTIPRYFSFAFNTWVDPSKAWLTVEADSQYAGKIVVNRTSRYRNPMFDYRILRGRKVLFVGLQEEWDNFRRDCQDAEWIKVKDYLELARMLKACSCFIGNQSSAFAVAEGLKVKRILEVYPHAPNVLPLGGKACDCWTQENFTRALALMTEKS